MVTHKHPTLLPLIALCLGFFMVVIDATIVNVALPSISHNLQGNISQLQWVIAGYSLTFACFLLSAGNLADRIGAKVAYLWGLGLFVIASLACAFSPTLTILIISRFFQGVAGALLVPTSLSLIALSYPDKELRDKAIGIWAAIGGIAAALGPLLGGLLTSYFGWRAVFFVNLPIGLLSIFLTLKYIPSLSPSHKGSFDIPGQCFAIISIGSLALSLIEGGKIGFFTPMVLSSFVIFFVTFIGFIIIELRSHSPMFPLSFFKYAQFSAANLVAIFLNIGFYGELFVLPLYFQEVRGYSTFVTGFAIFPLVAFVAISSYFAGKIVSQIGPKWPIVFGLILGALGYFLMLSVHEHGPLYIGLILPLAIIGFGSAFTMPAATIAAISALPQNRAGIASGALNASRQVGSLIGVAIFGAIINASSHFVSGMHITLMTAGIGYLIAACISLIFVQKASKKI